MTNQYINRETVKRELLSWAVCMNHPEYLIKDDALHIIDSIPAADVVEVVRCRECKYHEEEGIEMVYCPNMIGGWVENEWFCANGERKEGAN